jgi:hypothetical protein
MALRRFQLGLEGPADRELVIAYFNTTPEVDHDQATADQEALVPARP